MVYHSVEMGHNLLTGAFLKALIPQTVQHVGVVYGLVGLPVVDCGWRACLYARSRCVEVPAAL